MLFSVTRLRILVALLAVAGDGFQALAGKCQPPNRCYQSLSQDPPGAAPYCSSILTSPTVTVGSILAGSGRASTSTVFTTHTVTEFVTTGTRTFGGATDYETLTSLTSVTETVQSTVTSEATQTTLVVVTRPITQTSQVIATVDTPVFVYSTSTTIIVTSTTFVTTQTVGEYSGTETTYLATETQVVVTRVPRGDRRPQPVPAPTYLSTCAEDVVYSACEKLYPPCTVTVTRGSPQPPVVSNVYVTETRTVTKKNNAEATVSSPRTTKTVVIPGTSTIYSTVVETRYVTQHVSATSIALPTEVVVQSSTVTNAKTETVYSPTVTQYSTQVITSVFTDDLDGQVKTVTLSTLTVTQVQTSHTTLPTLTNSGFDLGVVTPWTEWNNGRAAPISINSMAQAGPYSLQMQFDRLQSNYYYSGFIWQPLPKAGIVPDQLYSVSAYLRVSASGKPGTDGCSYASITCAFGRDKSSQGNQYTRFDDTTLMVGKWFHAQKQCSFTAPQLNLPYDVGILIGFTCGAAQGYIDTVSFVPA